MVGKKPKKMVSTESNRQKNPQRSSSKSTIGSGGSKTSSGSQTSKSKTSERSKPKKIKSNVTNFKQIDKKYDDTFKTIYKATNDSNGKQRINLFSLTITVISWLQATIFSYFLITLIYHLINGTEMQIWCELGLVECIPCFIILYLSRFPNTGLSCSLLFSQYFLLFLQFSIYLQSDYDGDRSFFDRIFGLSSVCLMSSALHFFIIIQSMELIGEAEKRNDFSDKVIVEGEEKHRNDMNMMICGLVDEICKDDDELKIHLTDEVDHPKSINGADIETKISRVHEVNMDGNQINLSTTHKSIASVHVPKIEEKKSEKSPTRLVFAPSIRSKYNNCSKEDKALSPRKML